MSHNPNLNDSTLLEDLQRTLQQVVEEQKQMKIQMKTQRSIDRATNEARIANLAASMSYTYPYLRALPLADGTLPNGFPLDFAAYKALDSNQLNALLGAYELPQDGSEEDCRRRLGNFIGASHK